MSDKIVLPAGATVSRVWNAIPVKSNLNVNLRIKIVACKSGSCGGNQMLMLISKTLCCIPKYYVWYHKCFMFGIINILCLVLEMTSLFDITFLVSFSRVLIGMWSIVACSG